MSFPITHFLKFHKERNKQKLYQLSNSVVRKVSWFSFCCCDKYHGQKKFGDESICFILQVRVHHQGELRNREGSRSHWDLPSTVLLSLHRPICLGLFFPTVPKSMSNWENVIQACSQLSDLGNSSVEGSSFQVTLGCVKWQLKLTIPEGGGM